MSAARSSSTLHRRDLAVEQLVVHGDLAHLGFQPGDLIVAVITFALFQGCCCSRKRAVAHGAARQCLTATERTAIKV
jgi:hypothetical protein